MAYILRKGNEYCFLDGRKKIYRTQDIGFATRFTDIKKAYDLLYLARKKLKGFRVVDLDTDILTAGKCATKRRMFSELERMAIYNRCKGRCGICGRFVPYDESVIDHIISLAKGGTNTMENLQCAHSWCNYVKRCDSIEELTRKLVGIVLYQMKVWVGKSTWRRIKDLKRKMHYIYGRNAYRKEQIMMHGAKGNVIDYRTGARKCLTPTLEEIERSDSLREEAWEGIERLLKKELSDEAMLELKIAFYKASQNYLFVGRKK